jgi:hypothetical protein
MGRGRLVTPRGDIIMPVGVLVGVMGLLTVVAVYFWLVRSKGEKKPESK